MLLLLLPAPAVAARERTNVVFLLVDDLGTMDVGAYNPDTFYETPHNCPHYSNQGGFPGAAIRAGDWKLLERFEDGRVQLYDLPPSASPD